MKRREIVVSQAVPWGPIVARATTPRSGPRPVSTRKPRSRHSTSRWSHSRDRGTDAGRRRRGRRKARRARPDRGRGLARGTAADRADRGRARGPPVRRRASAVATRDRRARRHGPGNGRRAARRPRGGVAPAGHPAAARRRPRRARDRGRGRCPRGALRRGGRGPPVPGVARDARDRRLSTADHQGRRRADPRRRLRLHDALPAAPAADRRAGPRRHPGTALPVRHRVRFPRAVRDDQPRRTAAARSRYRSAAGGGGWRSVQPSLDLDEAGPDEAVLGDAPEPATTASD